MEHKISFKEKLTSFNIKVNTLNGIAAIVAANLVTPYFGIFAQRIGASDYQIAYLSSLPAFISIFALIPGAILIDSYRNKKSITGYITLAHKIFYLFLAFVPFIAKEYQPWLFVILVGLMNFPGSIAAIGYQSSIGDIFSEETRGRAMGLRNKYSSIFGLIITFVSGQLLTLIPKTDNQRMILYQVFFAVAFFIALGEVFTYLKFRGIENNNKGSGKSYIMTLKETFLEIPKAKKFLSFMLCSLIFHFGWQMAWPIFTIYTVQYLHADESWMSIIAIASSLSSILTFTLWVKFANKKGNSFALSVATLGMAITPFLYNIASSLIELVIYNIIIGISVAGTVLILFNILLDVIPKENRTVYIAVYTMIINISAVIAPIIGISIYKSNSIYIALSIAGLIRLLGSIAFFIRSKFLTKEVCKL